MESNSDQADLLNRSTYINDMTVFIQKLDKGVIAIDGEWGSGKTWLAKKMKGQIDEKGFASTVWLDTFNADWDDDPALSLITGIATQLPEAEKSEWLKESAALLSRLLPVVAKALFKTAANLAGIGKETADDIAGVAKDASQTYLERRLKDLADRQQTLGHLKKLMSDAIKKAKGKKLVVFVDELDRCSPAYAIQFLERLKHLFDLEQVVYVLFWNRQQLQKAVEKFYGIGSNGEMYLDKFVDYPLYLPHSHQGEIAGGMSELMRSMIAFFNHDPVKADMIHGNINLLVDVAELLSHTARESKRLAMLWVMSPNRNLVQLEVWLLGLKIKHPNVFARIRNKELQSHLDASRILKKSQPSDRLKPFVDSLMRIHACYHDENRFENLPKNDAQLLGHAVYGFEKAIPAAIRRIENFH